MAKQIYNIKLASKVSSVEVFGLGYEIITNNLIKGLIIVKNAILTAKSVKNCHFCIFEEPYSRMRTFPKLA